MQKKNPEIWNRSYRRTIVPGFDVCMLLVLVCRSDIKETTTWEYVDYIVTGQAADYKMQMDQFVELWSNESAEEVVLPSINDKQGPLQHMPATTDPTAWANTTIGNYFGKKSVVAIPRGEWEMR